MNVYVPVYKRWWFWVGVTVIAIGAFYVKGYIAWQGEGAAYDEYAKMTAEHVAQQRAQSAALEKAYREDTYGGATPEETLKLYIEALEKGDFELASKYWVFEKQSEFKTKVNAAKESGGLEAFITAYRKGRIEQSLDESVSGAIEIKLFEPGENVPFGARFVQNQFIQKWKILEL